MTYDEVVKLESIGGGVYKSLDGKIYTVYHREHRVTSVRDPNNLRFSIRDIVLVKPVGDYGEVDEVHQDNDWGNHKYAVSVFNKNDGGQYYYEYELEGLQ